MPNQNQGIYIAGPNNTVGGTTAGARNVISAAINATPTNGEGISISGPTANGNVVEGNYIGTDATGMLDFGNDVRGVLINQGEQQHDRRYGPRCWKRPLR